MATVENNNNEKHNLAEVEYTSISSDTETEEHKENVKFDDRRKSINDMYLSKVYCNCAAIVCLIEFHSFMHVALLMARCEGGGWSMLMR